MLFHAMRKNRVLRVLCMMMLMLIHMDAYMYEAIHLFHAEPVEQSVSLTEETLLPEDKADIPVWGDLSYSRTSLRLNLWSAGIALLPFLLWFSFVPLARDWSYRKSYVPFCALQKVRPHLAFCTLLI